MTDVPPPKKKMGRPKGSGLGSPSKLPGRKLTRAEIYGHRYVKPRAQKVDPADVPIRPRLQRRTGWQALCEDEILPLVPGEGLEVKIKPGADFDTFLLRVRSHVKKWVQPLSPYTYRCKLTTRRSVLIEVLE